MVGFKKLFQEKAPRPATSLGLGGCGMDEPDYHRAIDSPARNQLENFQLKDSQSLDVAHHFDQIEKQFEDLHDRLDRPTSSQSQLPPVALFEGSKSQNGRHVDLMDALVSSEQPQMTTPKVGSPSTSPYNEDVAERNMTRFLRIQYRNGPSSSRILSALYQEDVADRNIAKYNSTGRTMSSLSCWSSPATPGRVRIPESQRRKPRERYPVKPTWTSAENLRMNSSKDDGPVTCSQETQVKRDISLRPQRSAPLLCADEGFVPQEDAPPSPVQRLGVPPAYKQGKRWSNTPLPDSPTLPVPIPVEDNSGAAEAPSVPRPPSIKSRSSSLTPRSFSPPAPPGPGSKKNARGLSINTQLATKGRPKIVHRAIQPPTPSTSSLKRTHSIAEVMNSPLPASNSISPRKATPRTKASELVDLFTKAYVSAQGAHTDYETLQDVIVREVNSHEAFRRVPMPDPGPPFTPNAEQDKFKKTSKPAIGLIRSSSIKSRMNKGSTTKHERAPESRRSTSTSVGYDRLLRKVSGSPTQRRHTDAPAPTPGLLADTQPKQSAVSPFAAGEPITYMDVLRASSEQRPAANTGYVGPQVSHRRGRTDSIGNRLATPLSVSDMSSTPTTVYCMQAHSTPSSDESNEDSDDDIIHLPSPVMPAPRVQIEGVDENNIRYVIDAASPDDAQKLMYWPQRIRGGYGSNIYGNSLSPLSRARVQLRGSRSVETY